jgi:hypothetical protein
MCSPYLFSYTPYEGAYFRGKMCRSWRPLLDKHHKLNCHPRRI